MWASGARIPRTVPILDRSLRTQQYITIRPQPSVAILKAVLNPPLPRGRSGPDLACFPASCSNSPVCILFIQSALERDWAPATQQPKERERERVEESSTQQSVLLLQSSITMSCGGCGCCPKCGCRATCTCNRNIFSLESQTDFSYATGMSFTVADENDGQRSTAQGSGQSYNAVAGENGGKCVNCGWHAPGSCA